MVKVNWQKWFVLGEVLRTEYRAKRFEISEFTDASVAITLLDRKPPVKVQLSRKKLNLLVWHYPKVRTWMEDPTPMKLTTAVNKLWQQYGMSRDVRDESQYWALVCEYRRRKASDGLDLVEYREGGKVLYCVTRAERNPALRAACIEQRGLSCTACDFGFEAFYGAPGAGFIHVHHLDPIKNATKERKVSPKHLVPVCANCHAMIHRRDPPYTIEEIKKMVLDNKKAAIKKAHHQ